MSLSATPAVTNMDQYKSLTDRYQQLTDKYVNLKQKYRDSSKYTPWSQDSDTYSQRYRSPSPAPSSYVRSSESLMMRAAREYRTPPREQKEIITSESIIRRFRTPQREQVEDETPRYTSPSIIDRELDIFVPRYRSLEATSRRRMEATPPQRQPLPSAYSLFEKIPSVYDGISTMEELEAAEAVEEPPLDKLHQSPPCQVRVPANKYSLTYQHHPVSRRHPHVPTTQYEHYSPMHVRTTSKTVCNAKELSQIITEPSGGVYVLPNEGYNEVYPDVFIGDMHTALCTQQLRALGVTHVLNAAQKANCQEPGYYVNTSAEYYRRFGIEYLGVPATDSISFDLSQYFEKAASFIDSALHTDGRVLVHCHQGISRSATLVLAFLMMRRGMTAQDAVRTVRSKRQIIPNDSFLRQLCELNSRLMSERRSYYVRK